MAPNPRTFLDLSIGDSPLGRVVFELFMNQTPITAENFRALCTGSEGVSKTSGIPLSYQGSIFHRVIPEFMIQGGDFTKKNGSGGESIYGGTFDDEDLSIPVDKPGLLVMANRGPATNGSQFFITLAPTPHLTGKHVVFGRVVSGLEHVRSIEALPTDSKDRPLTSVMVVKSGELELVKKPVASKPASPPSRTTRRRSGSVSSISTDSGDDRRARKRSHKRRSSISSSSSFSSSASDSGSDSDDDRRRRSRRSSKSSRSKSSKKTVSSSRSKNSKQVTSTEARDEPRDARGIPLYRDETDAEIDARLEREEKEREERRKRDELERLKNRLGKSNGGGAPTSNYSRHDSRVNSNESTVVNYKGRGSMRHREQGPTVDLPSYAPRYTNRPAPPHQRSRDSNAPNGGTADRSARFDTWKHDLAGSDVQPRGDRQADQHVSERFIKGRASASRIAFESEAKGQDQEQERARGSAYIDRDEPQSISLKHKETEREGRPETQTLADAHGEE
ncbi:peptidyl-prolyl cis-trans isomerase [Phaffia rhodozyma]|uniref:peptidylprolyl isomerase n=1 Tax=Phaffia rhodozyma TaxID=264483 RepID=A0A0F7SW17_PHARH|nr:peptidyl-prolyl cis-trans isomerase [Phaffia rhodozyma]